MNTAWFDGTIAWIPGTLIGIAAGAFGACVGLARMSQERRRRWMSALRVSYWTIVSLSALLLLLALMALFSHQPRGVWFALLNPGVLGTALFGPLCFHALRTLSNLKEGA